jgi:hypothetical protein
MNMIGAHLLRLLPEKDNRRSCFQQHRCDGWDEGIEEYAIYRRVPRSIGTVSQLRGCGSHQFKRQSRRSMWPNGHTNHCSLAEIQLFVLQLAQPKLAFLLRQGSTEALSWLPKHPSFGDLLIGRTGQGIRARRCGRRPGRGGDRPGRSR